MNGGFKFSKSSEINLHGVHPDLVKVTRKALELSVVDFAIIEGVRTIERQKKLVFESKSQTMNSRHITGHAVDVFAYPTPTGTWEWKYYKMISEAFKLASKQLEIDIEWGGDWQTLKDGSHFQLPWG